MDCDPPRGSLTNTNLALVNGIMGNKLTAIRAHRLCLSAQTRWPRSGPRRGPVGQFFLSTSLTVRTQAWRRWRWPDHPPQRHVCPWVYTQHTAPMCEPCCPHSHPQGQCGSNYKCDLDGRPLSTVWKAAGAELPKLLKLLAGVGPGGVLSPSFQVLKSR